MIGDLPACYPNAMANYRLSVVIPTRNRPGPLGQLLDHLCRQSLAASEFEVVIVDDGSTPAIDQADLKAQYPFNLRVLRRDSRHGAHESRADGARIAQGSRVLFLDDDVIPEADVLAAHASDNGHFSVGVILYRPDLVQSLYARMQADRYRRYYAALLQGPRKTREVETFQICNTSGPANVFSQFLDDVAQAMQGFPLGGEGFDEGIMHVEARRRGYCFNILPDAVLWHVDSRSLADARRGMRRNGTVACQLALQSTVQDPEINAIFDIAGVLSGQRGRGRMYRARAVWLAPRATDALAHRVISMADTGSKRWLPTALCQLILTIAFWQGVRDVVPSWQRLKADLHLEC